MVQFQVEEVGRKSMEGRNVVVLESETARPHYLTGVLAGWVKTGCLIQVSSEAHLAHNRIFAPHQECSNLAKFPANVGLTLRIHLDKSGRVEARNISVVDTPVQIQTKVKAGSKPDVTAGTLHQ